MTFFKTFLFLVVPVFASSCNQPPQVTLGDSIPAATIALDIDVALFSEKMGANPDHTLLDVRTPNETAKGKIQDALEIDFRQAGFLDLVNQLPKDKPVFVYCRSGNRSGQAMAKMVKLGFTEVYNLKGGILAWEDAGRPVILQK